MPDRPLLDRTQLARIAENVPQTIAGLEKLLANVAATPATIDEANALAGSALTVAQGAMSLVALMAEALERLESVPATPPHIDPDDTAPRAHLGTISSQNHDQVEVTGGTIDNTPIGATTAADAKFKKVSASDQISSSVPTGTAPLVIASTTRVPNLNVATAGTADSLTSPTTYPANATDLPTVIALANALKAANIAKGV
jgi:hypothetical protein